MPPDTTPPKRPSSTGGMSAARAAFSALFGTNEARSLAAIERELELVVLGAGATLFRQGDDGDAIYDLLDGRLDVRIRNGDGSDVTVDALEAGAGVGEMELLTGQRRVATVSASTGARLARLSRHDFLRLTDGHPELLEHLARYSTARLRRAQLTDILRTWFGSLPTDALHAVQEAMTWVHLEGGQTLIGQDAIDDTMFLVVDGRLRLWMRQPEGNPKLVGEVRRGESVGEMAMLTGEPQSATVVAARDSNVVKIPRALIEQHPSMMAELARSIARRLSAASTQRRSSTMSFALVPAGPEVPLAAFAGRFAAALAEHGETLRLDAPAFDAAFGHGRASELPRDHPLNDALSGWLSAREAENEHLVYCADGTFSAWTQRCIRQVDRLLIVGLAGADPRPGPVEDAIARSHRTTPMDLVLIQPDDAPLPQGTLAWLTQRHVEGHHHVRTANDADFGRLSRTLTGRAVGVALSGGGARGYAHIGLLRAFEELDLPIDRVGGTSMGALVAGAYALSLSSQFCYDQSAAFGSAKRLIDITLPIAALTSSTGVTTMLRSMFGDVQIEDLWLPLFCVSTNMTRGEKVVHRSGSLWRAVRASLAIPGVFTPVLHDGDVLVDGGLMNNYPVDLMRDDVGHGVVIGSTAFAKGESSRAYDFGDTISGWRLLWRLFNPFTPRPPVPSILETLMAVSAVNGEHLQQSMAALADLSVSYPLERFGALGFDSYDEIVEVGYREGQRALREWARTTGEPPLDSVEARSTSRTAILAPP